MRQIFRVPAFAPSWAQIGKLGAIAVVRTGLNYFLAREMKEEQEAVEGEVPRAMERRASEQEAKASRASAP